MTTEERQQLIDEFSRLATEIVTRALSQHNHNGFGSPKLEGGYLNKAPQAALTVKNEAALSSGGGAVLSTSDSAIIDNMRTRINEFETKFRTLGLIK